jgi:transcriptional regulator with XRE-family HTH domain
MNMPSRIPFSGWTTKPIILYYGVRVAFVLWRQRRRARLSIESAASLAGIDVPLLRCYECGLKSPPLFTIHALLSAYQAEDTAVFFFCTIPISTSFSGDWLNRLRGRC